MKILTALAILLLAQPALAQGDDFPKRAVRMISPNAPGSSNDTLGRILGAKLGEVLGQQVIIENQAGASGLIRREDADAERLIRVITATARGDGSVPPDLLGRLFSQLGRLQHHVLTPRGLTIAGLTEREIEVLRLVADGFDTAEIAKKLAYSERTIKNVLHDVVSRFGLRNRTHAVAYALREGFI